MAYLTSLGWLMVLPIAIGLLLGRMVDNRFGSGYLWTLVLLLMGLPIAATEQSQRVHAEAEVLLAKARVEASQSRQQILERAHQQAQRLIDEAHQRVLERERSGRQRLEARLRQTAVLTAASLIREAAGPAIHQSLTQ